MAYTFTSGGGGRESQGIPNTFWKVTSKGKPWDTRSLASRGFQAHSRTIVAQRKGSALSEAFRAHYCLRSWSHLPHPVVFEKGIVTTMYLNRINMSGTHRREDSLDIVNLFLRHDLLTSRPRALYTVRMRSGLYQSGNDPKSFSRARMI